MVEHRQLTAVIMGTSSWEVLSDTVSRMDLGCKAQDVCRSM